MLKLPNDENAEGAKHFLQEIPDKNSHLGDTSELLNVNLLPLNLYLPSLMSV